MKNKLYFLSVLAVSLIPFVAPWEGAAPAKAWCATEGIQFVSNAASYMPVYDTTLSDLDARDAFNRPIRTAQTTGALRALFLQNLFQLAVSADLHVVRQIWQELALYSHLFNKVIWNIFYPLYRAATDVILLSTKRLVHNVHKLWITFFVGVLLTAALFKNLISKPSHNILILRC